MNATRISHLNISSRLNAGFGLLIMLTVIMGGVTYYSINNLSGLLDNLIDHSFQVTDRAQRLKSNIIEIDRDMGVMINGSRPETAANQVASIRNLQQTARENLAIVKQFYQGSNDDVIHLGQALEALQTQNEQAISLKQAGRQSEALMLMQPIGESQGVRTERELQKIIDFNRSKAAEFHDLSATERSHAVERLIATTIGLLILALLFARWISYSITHPLEVLRQRMSSLAGGDLKVDIPYLDGNTEFSAVAHTLLAFKDSAVNLDGQRWVKSGISELSSIMQRATTKQDFAQALINGLTPLCGAGVGIFYQANEEGNLFEILASYGLKKRRSLHTEFKLGEGIVGQAALERKSILLTDVPDEYARITTGTGEAAPRQILVAPALSHGRVLAVIELGTFHQLSANEEALIEELLPIIALNLEILERNQHTQKLLSRTQQQAEELRASEEELRAQSDQLQASNEELHSKTLNLQEQAEELRASEEELRAQREELQAANKELEQKSRGLEEQTVLLEEARSNADKRALERDTASRYKSEFLSNMSHELRTPLNSLLILARALRENEEGTLTEDQVDSAGIIHDSGTTLLRLINDILDLSKVEAGKMEILAVDIPLEKFATSLFRRFKLMAETKGLSLDVEIAPDLPETIYNDSDKIDQILNNLVGNAIKFTDHGGVNVHIKRPAPSLRLQDTGLGPDNAFEIEIHDTGIGIPADKIESIFNAFEQVDGSTSRLYGGTGLGLTISRRLAQFLGGHVYASSREGESSTFILTLPLSAEQIPELNKIIPVAGLSAVSGQPTPAKSPSYFLTTSSVTHAVDDDRFTITPKDESILIIEDDDSFARIVRDLSRKRGFKCLVAGDGLTGLDLARRYLPTGIVLDIGLPGLDGWNIMEQLKLNAETRPIPVHFISATDSSQRGLEMGAVGYLTKPVSKEQIEGAFDRIRHFGVASPRRLLLVEDDPGTRKAVNVMLSDVNVEIIEASTAEAAVARLRKGESFDCMILDLTLPGMSGLALLEQCTQEQLAVPPVVVYSGRDVTDKDTLVLKEYTDSIVIKGARSPERLLDEVTLFLHSVQNNLQTAKHKTPDSKTGVEAGLDGRTVLVVDDDMRNAFALSKVLRARGLKVLVAQDGNKAISQVNEAPEINVVLMDIMMPGMDGYTAIKEIRKQTRFRTLPIIALTAKAMLGDREKCIAAGASDYLSKPVDIDALMSMLREQLNVK